MAPEFPDSGPPPDQSAARGLGNLGKSLAAWPIAIGMAIVVSTWAFYHTPW